MSHDLCHLSPWHMLFPETDWCLFPCSCAQCAASCFLGILWRIQLRRSFGLGVLKMQSHQKSLQLSADESPKLCFYCPIVSKTFFRSKHLLMGMQLEGHQQSCSTEWVLAAALSRVQKLPPMSLKTLGRLTHNPHHRKMVFGPPAVWHHSAFPLLDLCQMPALRTLRGGACCWAAHSDSQYLIFHHTNKKQLKEPGVLRVLLLLFIF